jgi:hypothetical protein
MTAPEPVLRLEFDLRGSRSKSLKYKKILAKLSGKAAFSPTELRPQLVF